MAERINNDNFEEKVLNSDLPVVVDFYSDSCVACKRWAPVLGDIEDEFENKIKVFKVNTSFDVELARQYEVTANPTLIFVNDKKVVDRKVGMQKPEELRKWIEKYL